MNNPDLGIVDFFDPNNFEHIKAYDHLQTTGTWPYEFWEKIKDLKIPTGWQFMIQSKMADCWVNHMKQKSISFIILPFEGGTE